MLERIDGLPDGILGLEAKGRVSKEDYDRVVRPCLEEARREGRRVRFLYRFGPEFEGFTPSAAWEDFRVGLHYLRLFERCAVVSDVDWVRRGTQLMGALMPCPVATFPAAETDAAVAWLGAAPPSSLHHRLFPEKGVLLVEPQGRLRAGDFDVLEAEVDAWIELAGGTLRGLVVHARALPGWEDLGSFLRHLRFVREHHRVIRRVALATDTKIVELGRTLTDHFVDAEIELFPADAVERAVAWAAEAEAGAVRS